MTTERETYETYVVRPLTLILDNHDSRLYDRITEVAREAVVNDTGYAKLDMDTYEQMYRNQDSTFIEAAGAAVADLIAEMIEEDGIPVMWAAVLTDLLDLHTRTVRYLLGEQYLPDPRDMKGYLDGDEEGV
jgi:hypothetical protein